VRSQAIAIADQLRAAGFPRTTYRFSFLTKGTRDFAHEQHTKAPEGAATGAAGGAILGGALGWLVGIGSLAIPGLGPSSQRVLSWRLWRAQPAAQQPEALPEPSSAWVFRI